MVKKVGEQTLRDGLLVGPVSIGPLHPWRNESVPFSFTGERRRVRRSGYNLVGGDEMTRHHRVTVSRRDASHFLTPTRLISTSTLMRY